MNVTTKAVNQSTIRVSWGKVPPSERNGIIQFYQLFYQAIPGKGHAEITRKLNKSVQEVVGNQVVTFLYDLEERVSYEINITANTVKGEGPPSEPAIGQTTESGK